MIIIIFQLVALQRACEALYEEKEGRVSWEQIWGACEAGLSAFKETDASPWLKVAATAQELLQAIEERERNNHSKTVNRLLLFWFIIVCWLE